MYHPRIIYKEPSHLLILLTFKIPWISTLTKRNGFSVFYKVYLTRDTTENLLLLLNWSGFSLFTILTIFFNSYVWVTPYLPILYKPLTIETTRVPIWDFHTPLRPFHVHQTILSESSSSKKGSSVTLGGVRILVDYWSRLRREILLLLNFSTKGKKVSTKEYYVPPILGLTLLSESLYFLYSSHFFVFLVEGTAVRHIWHGRSDGWCFNNCRGQPFR